MYVGFHRQEPKAEVREIATIEDALEVIEIFEHCSEAGERASTTSSSCPIQQVIPQTPAAKASETASPRNYTNLDIFLSNELKFFANRLNILNDVSDLIDILNAQGFLLKKVFSSTS